MYRGTILEIKKNCVVVLTSEGDFIKMKRNVDGLMLGDIIMVEITEQRSAWDYMKGLKIPGFRPVFSMMAMAVLFLSFFIQPFAQREVYAHMSVDINPSIELEVNDKLRVIGVIARNKDAEAVLENIGFWQYMHVTDVVDDIVDTCEELGYLENKKDILLSTALKDESNNEAEAELNRVISSLDNLVEMNVASVYVPLEMHVKANKKGISTGKYALAMKMSQNGFDVTEEEIANKSIAEILSLTGASLYALTEGDITNNDFQNYLNSNNKPLYANNKTKSDNKIEINETPDVNIALAPKEVEEVKQTISVVRNEEKPNKNKIITLPKTSPDKHDVALKEPIKPLTPSKGNADNKHYDSKEKNNKNKGKGKDNTRPNPSVVEPQIPVETITPVIAPVNAIDDEYVAGIDYDGDGATDNEKDDKKDKPDKEEEESSEQKVDEVDVPVSEAPVEPSTEPESSTPIDNACSKDGYYYEKESVLFFEEDENGNIVEVWKEIEVKKLCP